MAAIAETASAARIASPRSLLKVKTQIAAQTFGTASLGGPHPFLDTWWRRSSSGMRSTSIPR